MIETIIVAFSVLATLTLGIFVVAQNPKAIINQLYGLMTLSFLVLMIANAFTINNTTFPQLPFIRIVLAATTVAIATLYFFVRLMGDTRRHVLGWSERALIVATAIIAIADLTPLVFSHQVEGQVVPSWGAVFFFAHFVLLLIASVGILIKGIVSSHGQAHQQFRTILTALAVVVVFAPITSFVLPVLLHQTAWVMATPLYIVLVVGAVGYAIIRHGFLDIKQTAVRGFAYVLSLASLVAIYYLIAYGISSLILQDGERSSFANPINIVLALLLTLIFQPVKRFFDKITDAVFYRNSYNANEFFTRLARELSTVGDLETLLRYSASEISRTLKGSFGAFYIYRENGQPFVISTTGRRFNLPTDDAEALKRYAELFPDEVLVREAISGAHTQVVHRLLVSHGIAAVLPLFRENTLLGFFFLGDHLSARYTKADINALETIADELTISIENALSVQEVRDVNEHLQQRIDNATKELRRTNEQLVKLDEVKDEFMSMASHQLRTPLTTIKGYISMVIEGDAGKITSAQKHLLSEAFDSSERMVRLIADFLNVSRLQTGKFVIEKIPTNLAKVVEQEIEELTPNAKARGITFVYKKPHSFPVLDLDDTKIRQVIMNFSDNAMYYSGAGTTVTITLKTTRDEVVFTVEDQGIGVPKDQQDELFQKFFRASNARTKRPDGTGVGLFLAKKVIDGHGGRIIFKSVEGKGSTFGFRLPLKKLKVDEV